MTAADRIRRALDTVDPDASGNAAGYTEGDVAGLLDERDRLEAALADERRQRAEVYRQHAGLTAELDRATTDRDRAERRVVDALRIHRPEVGHADGPSVCARCGLDRYEEPFEWPCATARALKGIDPA